MRSKSIILAATLLAASAGWTGMSAQQGQDLPVFLYTALCRRYIF